MTQHNYARSELRPQGSLTALTKESGNMAPSNLPPRKTGIGKIETNGMLKQITMITAVRGPVVRKIEEREGSAVGRKEEKWGGEQYLFFRSPPFFCRLLWQRTA